MPISRVSRGGDEEPAMTTTLSAVIPGCAARRRPGIHNHSLGLWISGFPPARRPGMTAERMVVPEICASLSAFAGTTEERVYVDPEEGRARRAAAHALD